MRLTYWPEGESRIWNVGLGIGSDLKTKDEASLLMLKFLGFLNRWEHLCASLQTQSECWSEVSHMSGVGTVL